MVRLLLDENLSPSVARALREDGEDVVHLRERGRLGVSDREVLALAYAEDRVLVTANVADFRRLAGARELHAGVVLITDGALLRAEQRVLLRRVVRRLRRTSDMVNRALTVSLEGEATLVDLPPEG